MKRISVLTTIIALLIPLMAMGCNSGKAQKGDNHDSAATDSVERVAVENQSQPKMSEEEIKDSCEQNSISLFMCRVTTTPEESYAFMTPGFGDLLKKVYERQEQSGELLLDYDPILGAQDYPDVVLPEMTSFELKSDTEAVATIKVWEGNNRTVTLKLINGQWLVDDVSGERANLKQLLAE